MARILNHNAWHLVATGLFLSAFCVAVRAQSEGFDATLSTPIVIDTNTGDLVASENAQLSYGDWLISADEIRLNRQTNRAIATGNVIFTRYDIRLVADLLDYSLDDQQARAENFRVGNGKYFVSGSLLVGNPNNFKFENINFHPGEPGTYLFKARANEIAIVDQKEIQGRRISFKLGVVPFFIIPNVSQPIDAERNIFKANLDYSGHIGGAIGGEARVPINSNFRAGGNLALTTKRGILAGPAFEYNFGENENTSFGSFTSGFIDDSLEEIKWRRFAAGMYEPFGLQVIDDKIYVTCKDRLVRLHDLNGDGEADFYESFSADDDVSTFFHAFNFDLQRDKKGNLYYAKSGQYTSYALPGSVIKVSADGKKRQTHCTGFRTPNGMGIMPDGRVTVSDNQGSWMPASKVSLCEPGGFYGYVQTHSRGALWAPDGGRIDHKKVIPPKTFDQPLIWMPQAFDNSSGGQLWVDDPRWGPLSGRLLHTSFGKGWLYYMMLQEIGGQSQAAIVKLKIDALTGIQRARVNPKDGQVYATGLNGWNGGGRRGLSQGHLHRFRYTGEPALLLSNVQVKKDGIELAFNFKLAPKTAKDTSRYQLEQWDYKWSSGYGSKEYLPGKEQTGREKIQIDKITLSTDGKSVHLEIKGLKPVNQVKIGMNLESSDGETFNDMAYLTINRVPK